jgi:molecular chaperone DnaK
MDTASEKLNTVFQAASQEMYNASNADQGGAQEGSTESANADDEVTDVDFEEVEEDKK